MLDSIENAFDLLEDNVEIELKKNKSLGYEMPVAILIPLLDSLTVEDKCQEVDFEVLHDCLFHGNVLLLELCVISVWKDVEKGPRSFDNRHKESD